VERVKVSAAGAVRGRIKVFLPQRARGGRRAGAARPLPPTLPPQALALCGPLTPRLAPAVTLRRRPAR